MTEMNPADMWAYATRPIADTDPNEPLLAVLEAADAAEPRVVRASRGAMVDGRFEVPRKGAVTLADVAETHRRIAKGMWDAVTGGMRRPDTQQDYLGVQ